MPLKLKGMASQKLMEHYCYSSGRKPRLQKKLFLKFMLLCKSNLGLARRFLNKMSISQNNKEFKISLYKSRFEFDALEFYGNSLLRLFQLIKPLNYEFAIGEDFDADTIRQLLPFVKDTKRLRVDRNNPRIIPIVREFQCPEFDKFTCQFELLIYRDFPLIRTKKLKMYTTLREAVSQEKFAQLFRHQFKEMHLTDIHLNNWFGYRLNKPLETPHPIEHIKLSFDDLDTLCEEVGPFVLNLAENLVNLKTVELKVFEPNFKPIQFIKYETLQSHLNGICNELLKFYDQVKEKFMGQLEINYHTVMFASRQFFNTDWVNELHHSTTLPFEFQFDKMQRNEGVLLVRQKHEQLNMHLKIELQLVDKLGFIDLDERSDREEMSDDDDGERDEDEEEEEREEFILDQMNL